MFLSAIDVPFTAINFVLKNVNFSMGVAVATLAGRYVLKASTPGSAVFAASSAIATEVASTVLNRIVSGEEAEADFGDQSNGWRTVEVLSISAILHAVGIVTGKLVSHVCRCPVSWKQAAVLYLLAQDVLVKATLVPQRIGYLGYQGYGDED